MSVDAALILPQPPKSEECERFQDEAPELTMEDTFYPLGFPLHVRSNSAEVMRLSAARWGMFAPRSQEPPIEADIHIIEGDAVACPPTPKYYVMGNFLMLSADPQNICTVEFPWGKTRMVVSESTLRYPHYFTQTFLDVAPVLQLSTRFATSVHAACVVLNGRGVLLCGDSGAGKSSLSYACARAGWQFVSDDASYVLHTETNRRVIGNYHQLRFRPSAADLFPEIGNKEISPRVFGKPTVEMSTASLRHVSTAESAHVDFIVFLNRRHPSAFDLLPYSKDAARRYMRKNMVGEPVTRVVRYRAIERLLTAEVLELRYQSLPEAVKRLERLVREGC
jgi:predicted ATPase